MDAMRGVNTSLAGSAAKQTAQTESPEQLLDVFKAAALSVTKLYKTSALAETKARSDGYQDCLDDLLAFLDKGNIGLNDGEGWRIRRWATERLDGRDVSTESEDEPDKAESTPSASESTRTNTSSAQQAPAQQAPPQTRPEPTPSIIPSAAEAPPHFVVPTQDNFTFQSSHQYPNIATLDLSDSRPHDNASSLTPRASKNRLNGAGLRTGPRSNHLGRGAGNKRKMDFDELFGGCLGGKDPFGNGGKRSRHT